MSDNKSVSDIVSTVNSNDDDKTAAPPPLWMKEVAQRRRSKESIQDVQKKWDEHVRTGGDGSAPWIQEIAKKKKDEIDRQKEEAETPQWIKELKRKNSILAEKITKTDE